MIMHVMGMSVRGFSYGFRYNLIGHLVTTSRRDQLAPSRPLIDPDLESVRCTHPPSRVPSPSLEIGYTDRRLGGASVWFIHNPNAMSISVLLPRQRPAAGFSVGFGTAHLHLGAGRGVGGVNQRTHPP